eukprot:TRINITY_DN3023_c0_g1_i2.p1 TRINITY_DN3023_c0_g1~~TRINITY_DN3023_c0_g1_i2.p1  ORF type:complete len:425 (+),score=83.73 TRINITY_DN3023_c0_g1_i2:52-1326(+)
MKHDEAFKKAHLKSMLEWRIKNTIDTDGYLEIVGDPDHQGDSKTIVNTCRGIYSLAVGAVAFKGEDLEKKCADGAKHGLDFLNNHLHDKTNGGYYWEVVKKDGAFVPKEDMKMVYGHAFVLLAKSATTLAGITPPSDIEEIWNLLEDKFWRPSEQMYADLISCDWATVDDYRGQNGCMHLCEALILAFKATRIDKYLNRALHIATILCKKLPSSTAGANELVWEHYHNDWSHDWEYNRADLDKWTGEGADPTTMGIREYRPWGFLPGHIAEWGKLLLLLFNLLPSEGWLLQTAERYIDYTLTTGWDDAHGGVYYSIAPDLTHDAAQSEKLNAKGQVVNDGKFMWPVSEILAATFLLITHKKGDERITQQHEKVWAYCEDHLMERIDNDLTGVWWSRLSKENKRLCVGVNVRDMYHPLAACFDML